MLATLTAALLLAAPPVVEPAHADKDAPPPKLGLFADESWYKNRKADEQDFVGVLSRVAERTGGTVGVGRFNPYRLTMNKNGKQTEREIYAGAHPEYLAPYVGKRIKLIGKAVETEVEGKVHSEIWPALLEVVGETPPQVVQEIPDKVDLLINNKVYMADATPEKGFVGILQKKKGDDTIIYQLLTESGNAIDRQDLHLYNEEYQVFAPYAGMRVKITGKKVSGIVGSNAFAYILPGKLEVLTVGNGTPGTKVLKVLARGTWRVGDGAASLQLVIRSAKELALSHGQPADKAEDDSVKREAVTEAAHLFKVEVLDWKTQMVIVASAGAKPTSGYTVEITDLVVQDDVLTVHWRLNSPKAGDFVNESFTHPAQAVLTERFDGKVVFETPPKPPKTVK